MNPVLLFGTQLLLMEIWCLQETTLLQSHLDPQQQMSSFLWLSKFLEKILLGMGPTTFTIFDNLQSKKIDCLGQAEQNGLKHYTFISKDTNIRYRTLLEYLLYESHYLVRHYESR